MAPRSTEAIKVNNALRRTVRSAVGTLTLMATDPAKRLAAAAQAFRSPDPEQLAAHPRRPRRRDRRRASRRP